VAQLAEFLCGHDAEDQYAEGGGTEDPGGAQQIAQLHHLALPDVARANECRDRDRPDREDDEGHVEPDDEPVEKGHRPILGPAAGCGQRRAAAGWASVIPWPWEPGDRRASGLGKRDPLAVGARGSAGE
jgi:hypothetical protein